MITSKPDDALRQGKRDKCLTNIRTVHLWKAPSSVIPRALASWKSKDEENDVFIPEEYTGTAMHQDKVRVIITKEPQEGKRREGIVVKVLERGMDADRGNLSRTAVTLVLWSATILNFPGMYLYLEERFTWESRNGDKVVAWKSPATEAKNRNPEGKIIGESGKLPCTWNRYPCHCKKLWHSKRISG